MARKKSQNMQRKNTNSRQMRAMEALVQENIVNIAALAWAGYQQEGRGFVLVPFDNERLDAQYHGEKGDTWEDLNMIDTLPEAARLVSTYDPKTQVIAVLATPKEANAYLMDGLPLPPPLAYEKVMAEG